MTEPDAKPPTPDETNGRPSRRGRNRADGSKGDRSSPGGKRHQARILALQILFEVDLTEHDPMEVLARTFAESPLGAKAGVALAQRVPPLLHWLMDASRIHTDAPLAQAATAP